MTESWLPTEHDFENFFSLPLNMGESNDKNDDVMSKTLAMFVLLYDLPFAYLVPSEEYLCENQTRFFYLDPNWIKALLDGAMSLGRNAGIDYAHDSAYLEKVYTQALGVSEKIRPKLQGKPAPEQMSNTANELCCTGFLMRSPLVRGWRGLEFKAYGDDGAELYALRIETLADDILIGLYRGVIQKLSVFEPPEGLHYGFNRGADGKSMKVLRRLEDGKLFNKIAIITEKPNRVIDFAATAKSIGDALNCKTTSAHIALEMIQNPHMLNLERK